MRVLRLATVAIVVSVIATGCSRDTSDLRKTLVGHWVATGSSGSQMHHCYSPDGKLVYYSTGTGDIGTDTYKVVLESPKERSLFVETNIVDGAEKIDFNQDGKSITKTLPGDNKPYGIFRYVDANTGKDPNSCR